MRSVSMCHSEVSVDRIYIIDKRTGERSCIRRSKSAGRILESTPLEAVAFQTAMMKGEPVAPFRLVLNMELP